MKQSKLTITLVLLLGFLFFACSKEDQESNKRPELKADRITIDIPAAAKSDSFVITSEKPYE